MLATLLLLVVAAIRGDLDEELSIPATAPVLAGRGPALERRVTAGQTGALSIWAEAEECDLFLRAERPDGALLREDDDGGGASAPWLLVVVQAGEELVLRVAATTPEGCARATLRVRELPADEEVLGVVEYAREGLGEARAEAARGDVGAATERARELLEALSSVDGACASAPGWSVLEELVAALHRWGDTRAYAEALERLHAGLEARCPPTARRWLQASHDRASVLMQAGRAEEALPLLEAVVRGYERGGASALELALARFTLGQALREARQPERAVEAMRAARVEALALLPEGDWRGAWMEAALGIALQELGRLDEARRAQERAADALTRALAPGDPFRLAAQSNLASTLSALGDKPGALAIHRAIERERAALGIVDDVELWKARYNQAVCLHALGELEEARALLEALAPAYERLHAPASRDRELLDVTRADVLLGAGEAERALARVEAREALRRAAGQRDPLGAWRCATLRAKALASMGRDEAALGAAEQALDAARRAFEAGNPDRVEALELDAALALALGRRERAAARALEAARELRDGWGAALAALPMRAAEAAQAHWARLAADAVALLDATLDEDARAEADALALELCEAARGIGVRALRLAASAEVDVGVDDARAGLLRAAAELARVAALSPADPAELERALAAKEAAERGLRARLEALGAAELARAADAAAMRAALGADEAALAYWRVDVRAPLASPLAAREPRLIAFVLRAGTPPARVELGPLAPIQRAAAAWRAALIEGAEDEGARGEALRALVLDPLRPALGDARRWSVVLDDALHEVPFDALPFEGERLGERVRLVLRPSLLPVATRTATSAPRLLAVGGVDYEPPGLVGSALDAASLDASPAGDGALTLALRSGVWRAGFEPLWQSAREVEGVAALWRERSGEDAALELLTGPAATRARLFTGLGRASHVHVATHGFFALADARDDPVGRALARRSPLALCGLALAGANAAFEGGGAQGLVTAEELAALDLGACRLVVLSACATNVGVRQAGQGVASFQKALHAAGAEVVVSSLWEVGDARTRELMLAFYRGLWRDGLEPQEALGQARRELRAARAPTRDWAAWVLSRR